MPSLPSAASTASSYVFSDVLDCPIGSVDGDVDTHIKLLFDCAWLILPRVILVVISTSARIAHF